MDLLLEKKAKIEREFSRLHPEGASISVIPILPDKLNIEVKKGEHRAEKTIHVNEEPFIKRLLKFHCLI